MKAKIPALGIVVLIFLFVNGCAQQVRPHLRSHIGTERVFSKNYEIGQRISAYVGQPIVKVKDYKVNRYSAKHMRASEEFVISGGIVTISGDKNTDYVVWGETTVADETYTIVGIPSSLRGVELGVLIKADGSVYSKVHTGTTFMVYTFRTSPDDLRFAFSKDEKVDVSAGYLNHELIYGGTDGKSITITYREYTSEDLARPAFFQNVVYEAGKSQIRFRDTVLLVHETTNEKIVFTVLSDGLSE